MSGKKVGNKGIQAALGLLLLLSTTMSAVSVDTGSLQTDTIVFHTSFTAGDPPYVDVSVLLPAITVGATEVNGQTFTTISLADEGFTITEGEAQLPVINRFLAIPAEATPELVVTSVEWQTLSLAQLGSTAPVVPVQPSLVKLPGSTVEFAYDAAFYSSNCYTPSVIAHISDAGAIRSRHVALLTVYPVRYNPMTASLQVMTSCELRISLPNSDIAQTTADITRYSSPAFEPLLQQLMLNYDAFEENTAPKHSEGYLIVVHDAFYDAIMPLATWKQGKGFECTVTKTSEISGGVTKENIKNYIVDAYNTWTTPPAYVLLVGDVAQIPTWTGTASGTCTDLYYATIDTGNYFADVIVSRFSASTTQHVTTMVDKTIFYEEGVFSNDSWIKKAAFIASSDMGGMAEQTHDYVINTYLIPHNYTCDKIYESQGGSTSDITNALNDGRSICVYSGHGYSGGWACVPFSQSNVEALQNQDMYPFVCSHACSTNPFSQTECFGETWLRVANKGAIAFWGASASTMWDEDDILERRMFDAWWNDSIPTIGGMTNRGLYYLYQHYGGGGSTKYYFEAYNVLGDSSICIHTGESQTNVPPNIPDQPAGPASGEIGIEYTFASSTIDRNGDDVYYMVSWGDSVSEWLGPYDSGETVTLTHTWTMPGDYTIKVKAKDTENLESGWSPSSSITILAIPRIEIGEITGGFGLSAEIKNVGAGEATNVTWTITLDGGLVLLGRETTGTFSKIMPGFSPKAETGVVFGIGNVDIIVSAGDAEQTATAFLLGPFFLKVLE